MVQALNNVRVQLWKYRAFIDIVKGAVFLGSPHLVTDKVAARDTLDMILRCQSKTFGRGSIHENDVQDIMEICKEFELVRVKFPVISAFESKETQLQRSVFARFRKNTSEVVSI